MTPEARGENPGRGGGSLGLRHQRAPAGPDHVILPCVIRCNYVIYIYRERENKTYIYIYTHVYTYMYIHTCVYIYIYICIHI